MQKGQHVRAGRQAGTLSGPQGEQVPPACVLSRSLVVPEERALQGIGQYGGALAVQVRHQSVVDSEVGDGGRQSLRRESAERALDNGVPDPEHRVSRFCFQEAPIGESYGFADARVEVGSRRLTSFRTTT